MKFILFLALILGNSVAVAQDAESSIWDSRFGIEVGALYLGQSSGGNTVTALPAIIVRLWKTGNFELDLQAGATAYKDRSTGESFSITALRLTPIYRFDESLWSLEAVVGVQSWQKDSSVTSDFGLRVGYGVSEIFDGYIDSVFAGIGSIAQSDRVTWVTLGLKKYF